VALTDKQFRKGLQLPGNPCRMGPLEAPQQNGDHEHGDPGNGG